MGDTLPVEPDTVISPAEREAETSAGPPFVVLEKLEGWGDVFDGERLLGASDYSLKDVQETTNAAPLRGAASVMAERQRNVFGVVRPREAGLLDEYVGRRLTLQLADGRRLPFTVSKVMGPHRFLVQGLNLAD
jgi:hypothetical protein